METQITKEDQEIYVTLLERIKDIGVGLNSYYECSRSKSVELLKLCQEMPHRLMVWLDNDQTTISFHKDGQRLDDIDNFFDLYDEEHDINFRVTITQTGDDDGVFMLFDMLGIKAEGV